MPNAAYFTICSVNYLAYALTLYHSLAKADAKAGQNFKVVLVDETIPDHDFPFEVIRSEDLGIEHFWDMAMRYSVMEMNTAVKPAAILHLFDQGFDNVVYLDPDIFVLKPLTHVKDLLADGASIVLTPHSTEPLEDGFDPDDVRLMRTGVYNLGFVACANTDEARNLMAWWHRRMIGQCVVDLENGLFVDQKFMDLAPSYAPATRILHHKGYNTAYWNLMSRPISHEKGEWQADQQPLHFFHFSGVVPGDTSVFSKHQNRYTPTNIGPLNDLLNTYLDALDRNEHSKWAAYRYTYAQFTNGDPVPDIARRIYQTLNTPSVRTQSEAFAHMDDVMDQPITGSSLLNGLPETHLMHQIASERPDLRNHFPLSTPTGREAFARWMLTAVNREYGVSDAAYASITRTLSARNPDRQAVSLRHPRRWAAQKTLALLPHVRRLTQLIPVGLRERLRDLVLRSASGHGLTSAAVSNGGRKRSLPQPLRRGIGLYGYLTAVSGVAEGARRMLSALEARDIPHSAHVVSSSGSASEIVPEPKCAIDGTSPHDILLFHVNADQTPFIFDSLPAEEIGNKYRIGYWAWELSKFPADWQRALDYVDEVWVPSAFVRAAVAERTNKPVHVFPHPVPDREDSGEGRRGFGLPENRFLFLSSLDLNSFSSRKNPQGVYEAFCQAFPGNADDGPLLVLKVHGGLHLGPRRRHLLDRLAKDPRVILIDMPLDDHRYAALQRNCDAFVSLHRSEGFGMNMSECMHLGKPVIATRYSGNLDFMSDENAYLVDCSLIPLKDGDYPQWEGQEWADPDLRHAAKLMRQVVETPEEAQAMGAIARETILSGFTTEVLGDMVSKRLDDIIAENVGSGD